MIYHNKKRKVTGETRDGIFKKTVKEKNIYRMYNGWSISLNILEDLQELNKAFPIELLDKKNKILYKTTVDVYFDKGIELWIPGYEQQMCLPLTYFTKEAK
jgi:hypothetical protein